MVAVAQLVRASDCGSEGRGFEPHLLVGSSPICHPEKRDVCKYVPFLFLFLFIDCTCLDIAGNGLNEAYARLSAAPCNVWGEDKFLWIFHA